MFNNGSIFGISALVWSSCFKFFQVNNIISIDNAFKILCIEKFNHFTWNNFVESFFKGVKLLFDLFVKQIVSIKLAVLLFVILCHLDFKSIFYQLLNHLLAKMLQFDSEVNFKVF